MAATTADVRSDPLSPPAPRPTGEATAPTGIAGRDRRGSLPSRGRSVPWLALAATLLATLLAAAPGRAQDATPNPTLRQVWLTAGIHRIRAEVAATPAERSRGLMMRQSLAPNHGMLFVFESVSMPCFWMKNTLIPLTIAFIAEGGEIVTLADMQPHDETSHCPARPVRFALEMEQGWFRGKGLRVGDRIGGLDQRL